MASGIQLDHRIFLRNNKEALRWKIFREHRLPEEEFERAFRTMMEGSRKGGRGRRRGSP